MALACLFASDCGNGVHAPLQSSQVLPIEKLLRESWDTGKYLRGSVDANRPFMLEDTSKAHVTRINKLMSSDLDWATIGLIALLSSESDLIGSWAEGCPCHKMQPTPRPGKKRTLNKEAAACPLRCCRAPELAVGKGLRLLLQNMQSHRGAFNEVVSRAPEKDRAKLTSAWSTACSRLFGCLPGLAIHDTKKRWVMGTSTIHKNNSVIPVPNQRYTTPCLPSLSSKPIRITVTTAGRPVNNNSNNNHHYYYRYHYQHSPQLLLILLLRAG